MNTDQINNRKKEIYIKIDQIKNEWEHIVNSATDENGILDESKVPFDRVYELQDEEDELKSELLIILKNEL
jgi:hypothetical protein